MEHRSPEEYERGLKTATKDNTLCWKEDKEKNKKNSSDTELKAKGK